jgi:hypothetical protein
MAEAAGGGHEAIVQLFRDWGANYENWVIAEAAKKSYEAYRQRYYDEWDADDEWDVDGGCC